MQRGGPRVGRETTAAGPAPWPLSTQPAGTPLSTSHAEMSLREGAGGEVYPVSVCGPNDAGVARHVWATEVSTRECYAGGWSVRARVDRKRPTFGWTPVSWSFGVGIFWG